MTPEHLLATVIGAVIGGLIGVIGTNYLMNRWMK
jgi:hypothetical protein